MIESFETFSGLSEGDLGQIPPLVGGVDVSDPDDRDPRLPDLIDAPAERGSDLPHRRDVEAALVERSAFGAEVVLVIDADEGGPFGVQLLLQRHQRLTGHIDTLSTPGREGEFETRLVGD